MRFLSSDESHTLDQSIRHQFRSVADRPRVELCYASGQKDYAPAARLIAQAAGTFSEAAVLFSFCMTGDGWLEHNRADPGWQTYRQWRKNLGETRRLYDAPGHLAESGEIEHLSRVIEFALILGWDAMVTAKPGRNLLFLSHDDRLDVMVGFEARTLAKKLLKLGYWSS